ncbi:MAG: molybdopterin-dependent oxidoreductase [Chitinophagales bacterium]
MKKKIKKRRPPPPPVNPEKKTEEQSGKQIRRRSFLAFGIFAGLYGIGYGSWRWLYKHPGDGGILGGVQAPLRPVLNGNEKIFGSHYNPNHLAKIYPKDMALARPRVNGKIGLDPDFSDSDWTLNVQKADGKSLFVSLDELKALPKSEIVFNFKCIEGWSQITYWAGVKFSDFMNHYDLVRESNMKYVGLSTPDTDYYVGIDMGSAMHPQTILAYEMNGQPLTREHGQPLRLIIPVKYGIKNLKRIGSIYFDNERPSDYWAERGYDYYSGL